MKPRGGQKHLDRPHNKAFLLLDKASSRRSGIARGVSALLCSFCCLLCLQAARLEFAWLCRVRSPSRLPGLGLPPLARPPPFRRFPALRELPAGFLPFARFRPFMGSLPFAGPATDLHFAGSRPFTRSLPFAASRPSLFRAVCSLFSNSLYIRVRAVCSLFSNSLVLFERFAPCSQVLSSLSLGLLQILESPSSDSLRFLSFRAVCFFVSKFQVFFEQFAPCCQTHLDSFERNSLVFSSGLLLEFSL